MCGGNSAKNTSKKHDQGNNESIIYTIDKEGPVDRRK